MSKDIDFILSQPEGQYVEFKRSTSANMAKDLVAFANTGGGTLIIGIDDNGVLIGVTNANRQKSHFTDSVRSRKRDQV